MTLHRSALVLALAGLVAGLSSSTAHAWTARPELVLPRGLEEDLRWVPQPLAAPVSPGSVSGLPPYLPGNPSTVLGELRLSAGAAATFWLPSLEVARVQVSSGSVRFIRVPERDASDAELRLDEQGIAARKNEWYLAEPPGRGSVWLIVADSPAQVRVERPEEREDALGGEATRARILAWIDGTAPRPPLTFLAQLRTELSLAAELESVLLAADGSLREPIRAWRKAAALDALARWQPLRDGTFRRFEVSLFGEPVSLSETSELQYTRVEGPSGTRALELNGPGVLSLRVRPVIGESGTQPRKISIVEDGRTVLLEELQPQPSWEREETPTPFPQLAQPRLLPSGERVGVREELRVPLRDGRHTYQLSWEGGALLVHAEGARRKAWTAEAITRTASASGWAKAAWKQLGESASPTAALLRRLIHPIEPGLSPTAPALVIGGLPELAATYATLLEAERGAGLQSLEDRLAKLKPAELAKHPLLEWDLRIRTAKLLTARGLGDRAQRILARAREFPESGWMAARAAAIVNELPRGMPLRSRELAALELAWRREPLSTTIQRQYRLAWSRASRWKLLGPDRLQAHAPAPQRWMDLEELSPGETGGAGVLRVLGASEETMVLATGSTVRPTVLRAFVLFAPGTRDAVQLKVGKQRFRFEPFSRVEPISIALPPGEHPVALEGSGGTRAFLSLALQQPTIKPDVAYVHTHWPLLSDGKPVHFKVPDPKLASPIRLHLRGDDGTGEAVVWMHTDVAPPRRMVLVSGSRNDRHFDLQNGSVAPGPAAAVVYLPPLAREVWFVPERKYGALVAGLSVRQDDFEEQDQVFEPGAPSPAVLERLHQLSQQLRQTPEATGPRLDRAELLIGIDRPSFARTDLSRLLSRQEELAPEHTSRLVELLERLVEVGGERVAFRAPVETPTLISPAIGSLGEGELEQYRKARALRGEGRSGEAGLVLAELYRKTQRPELGLEALEQLETELTEGRTRREAVAPIARVLALNLDAWADLPTLRRIRMVALDSARWDRLQGARDDAGLVFGMQARSAQTDDETLRKALLATPWSLEEGRLVRGGDSTVLALQTASPTTLKAEAFCDAATRAVDQCAWTLRIDNQEVAQRTSAPGETVQLEVPLASGAHQVELMLGRSPAHGLVRFEARAAVVESPATPLSLTRSRADAPVMLDVLGPTALRIRARAVTPGKAKSLRVSWKNAEGGAESLLVALPGGRDPAFRAPRFTAGPEAETTLILATAGPHQLALEPDDGEALVRMDLSVPDGISPSAPPLWADAPTGLEPLPWPALPSPLSLLPNADSQRVADEGLGTISPELAARAEDFGDGEITSRPPQTGLELRLGLRRELSENSVWLKVQPKFRYPQSASPVAGVDAALFLARLPGGFRTQLEAGTSGQWVEGAFRSSLRGSLFLDRPLRFNSDWMLLPSATLTAERFQGEEGDERRFDRDVVWRYGLDHPQRLTPSLTLRYSPLQDQIGRVSVSTTTNADFQTLDSVTGRTRWSSLLGGALGAVRTSLGYELSYRMQDVHRSESYLRHGVSGRADWAAWNLASSRLLLFAEDRVLWSGRFGLQNVFSIGVRMDFSAGRGLRDVLPFEEEFEQLLDPSRSVE